MFHVITSLKKSNRVFINSVIFLVFASADISTAQSQFNFSQWRSFTNISKKLYVIGSVDALTSTHNKVSGDISFHKKILACVNELQISIDEIVAMIDNFYLNSDNWKHSPQTAINYQLIIGHCQDYLPD